MASQKNKSSAFPLKWALFISFAAHGLLFASLWYGVLREMRPSGQDNYSFVAVSLVSGTNSESPSKAASEGSLAASKSPSASPSLASSPDATNPGEGGTSEILRQIRNRIERAKFYPLTAKRQKIEGSPVIEFQIDETGRVRDVTLKQTSGSEILDEAAKQTVTQAEPLPFYPDPIALSIHYALGDQP